MQYSYYENNALVAQPTYSSPNGASNVWVNWSGVKNLQHGGQYGVCAQGSYVFPNDSLWISDGPNSCSMGTALGRRAYTTIDRSKPSTSIALAGGAAATKDAKVAIQVAFSDDVAGPFPANFMCFQFGGTSNVCDSSAGFIYGYNSACSVPAGGGKSTTFTCTADFGSGANPAPDGPVWACVVAADASIPDNPSGPNQAQSAEKANLSDAKCDSVMLDRARARGVDRGPGDRARPATSSPSAPRRRTPTSGVAGGYDWSFGDNSGGATGDTVKHTFTQAGTYEVRAKTLDGAGNQGSATKVVTVSAPGTAAARRAGGSRRAAAPTAARRRTAHRGGGPAALPATTLPATTPPSRSPPRASSRRAPRRCRSR